jgi:hypothetical protein
VLFNLTEENLKEMGVEKIGDRLLITDIVQTLYEQVSAPSPTLAPTADDADANSCVVAAQHHSAAALALPVELDRMHRPPAAPALSAPSFLATLCWHPWVAPSAACSACTWVARGAAAPVVLQAAHGGALRMATFGMHASAPASQSFTIPLLALPQVTGWQQQQVNQNSVLQLGAA